MTEMLIPATNKVHLPAADIFVGAVTRIVADRDEHGNWVIGVTVPGPDIAHGQRLHTTTFWTPAGWNDGGEFIDDLTTLADILDHMVTIATRKAHQ